MIEFDDPAALDADQMIVAPALGGDAGLLGALALTEVEGNLRAADG